MIRFREDLCMLSRTSKELMKNIKHSKSIRNIKWRTMLLEIVQLSVSSYEFISQMCKNAKYSIIQELCYGFSYFTQRYQRKSCKVKEKVKKMKESQQYFILDKFFQSGKCGTIHLQYFRSSLCDVLENNKCKFSCWMYFYGCEIQVWAEYNIIDNII